MIGLDGVIGVLDDVARAWQHLVKYADVGRCPVRVYLGRICTVLESMGEEPAGGDQIPFRRGQHVDDLAELVDRTVQIDPVGFKNLVAAADLRGHRCVRLRVRTR
jgi:hypothetical protein